MVTEAVEESVGAQQFDRLVRAIAEVTAQATSVPEAVLHRWLHKAVVNGVIREADLLGDFLVVPVDPVDFTLTNDNGLKVNNLQGRTSVDGVGNAFFVSDGPNQLLIVPNARAEQYRVELVGVGSGEFRFGASFVTAFGQVTTILLNGNLRDGRTVAVLDFTSLDGRIEQQSVFSQPVTQAAPIPAAAPVPATPIEVVAAPTSIPSRPAASVQENPLLAALLTRVVVAVPQVANPGSSERVIQVSRAVAAEDHRVTLTSPTRTSGSDAGSESSPQAFRAVLDEVFQAWPSEVGDGAGASRQDLTPSEQTGIDLVRSFLSAASERSDGTVGAWADLASREIREGLVSRLTQAGRATFDDLVRFLRSQLHGATEQATPAAAGTNTAPLAEQLRANLHARKPYEVTPATAELLLAALFVAGAQEAASNRQRRRRALRSEPARG
jgi:hypothetical protein